MGIRKGDLKDFISGKVDKRKQVIWEAARSTVEAVFKPVIFEAYKVVEPVERQAQIFHDALLNLSEHRLFKRGWGVQRIMQDLNSAVIGIRADIVRKETNWALYNLLDRGTNRLMDEVLPFVDDLKTELSAKIEEYQTLGKLKREIITVIDASHNGDKAYKRLQELGVDLTGFTGVTPNLPAVIKLSANVCVLNGDCE